MNSYLELWKSENKYKRTIIIIGAGSLGKMTASILVDNEIYEKSSIAFVDDQIETGSIILGFPLLGKLSEILIDVEFSQNADFVIAIANNKTRKKIDEKYPNLNYVNVIHNSAVISKYAKIGTGNIILPNVSVDPEAIIMNHVVLNKNSTIGHNVTMCNYTQACPGTNLGGYIDECAFLGLGSIVLPNIRIGRNSIIGAGSVVNKEIPDNYVAMGTPCIPVKAIE
ncbi:hypothetical protein [Sporosarcina sp. Marseille-Q4943]|uniref:PglD-related sugar-binding protein n=1 Tax=Sporosarcina sp. Marseille-Q4943 TaxID=2942204 RepID=UPI00208DC0FE|nr:hypothetical protein [Sporosarcina sp. Marseille-Q4943]